MAALAAVSRRDIQLQTAGDPDQQQLLICAARQLSGLAVANY